MNQNEAMKLVKHLIIGLQRARSVNKEQLENMEDEMGNKFPSNITEVVLEDLTPWLHGPKADRLILSLQQIQERGKITGMELYNFMVIIHLLNPTIGAMVGTLTDTIFPQPNINWVRELGIH